MSPACEMKLKLNLLVIRNIPVGIAAITMPSAEHTHLTDDGVAVARFVLVFAVAGWDVLDGILEAILGMALVLFLGELGSGRDVSGRSDDGTAFDAHGDGEQEENNNLKRNKRDEIQYCTQRDRLPIKPHRWGRQVAKAICRQQSEAFICRLPSQKRHQANVTWFISYAIRSDLAYSFFSSDSFRRNKGFDVVKATADDKQEEKTWMKIARVNQARHLSTTWKR